MTNARGFAPSIGQLKAPKNLRKDLSELSSVVAKSDIDIHIVRLLGLHPTLQVRFRNQDLASLDVATKKTLLKDLYVVLGIRPLRKTR